MATLADKDKLILTADIQDRILDASILIDDLTKRALKMYSRVTREHCTTPKLNSYARKTMINTLLKYWHETIRPDTEMFWLQLRVNKVDFARQDPLRFALGEKRFKTVEQAMDARIYWKDIKGQESITDRFSQTDIAEIDNIIAADEKSRLDELKRRLKKKTVLKSSRFHESIAYFITCDLLKHYFTREESEILIELARNGKIA